MPAELTLVDPTPRPRLCVECRVDNHGQCTGEGVLEGALEPPPCPCFTCNPPAPQRCTSCGHQINLLTGECAGCSD